MSDAPKLTIAVLDARRGGRPRAVHPHDAPVSTRIPAAEYDTLVAAANARGVSVSAYGAGGDPRRVAAPGGAVTVRVVLAAVGLVLLGGMIWAYALPPLASPCP